MHRGKRRSTDPDRTRSPQYASSPESSVPTCSPPLGDRSKDSDRMQVEGGSFRVTAAGVASISGAGVRRRKWRRGQARIEETPMRPDRFTGKVGIITGGAMGI